MILHLFFHYVSSNYTGIAKWAIFSTKCIVFMSQMVYEIIVHVLGAVSIRKTVLPGMAIPMVKIRRPNGRLIFNMEIAIGR